MRKLFSLIVALILTLNINAQICPLDEAVDFTAIDNYGNEIHLFDILDNGQAVFIHFFLTYNFDPLIMPYMTEAFRIMGCNMNEVFFMEIAHREDNVECQDWIDRFHVAYPTISIEGGGQDITDLYDIQACPTLILIMPDRSITIHGAYELYPTSTDDVVNALAQYGNLQPHNCNGSVHLENDTVMIIQNTYRPGRLALTNLTNNDIIIESFTSDSIFDMHCFHEDNEVTNGGMTLYSGQTQAVQVYVDVNDRQNFEGKMYIHTSEGDLEANIIYVTPLNIIENNDNNFSVFPNPAKDFVIIKCNNLETVSIYNALGQKMEEIHNCEDQQSISIAHYPRGIYYIVGVARLERATACTPCKNASQLHHTPIVISTAKIQKIF